MWDHLLTAVTLPAEASLRVWSRRSLERGICGINWRTSSCRITYNSMRLSLTEVLGREVLGAKYEQVDAITNTSIPRTLFCILNVIVVGECKLSWIVWIWWEKRNYDRYLNLRLTISEARELTFREGHPQMSGDGLAQLLAGVTSYQAQPPRPIRQGSRTRVFLLYSFCQNNWASLGSSFHSADDYLPLLPCSGPTVRTQNWSRRFRSSLCCHVLGSIWSMRLSEGIRYTT